MGRGARFAVSITALAIVAVALALTPGIRESKEERAASERRERAEARAARVRELRAEQRPRFARSASGAPVAADREEELAARAELVEELADAVMADAKRRVRRGSLNGPIRRVECEPYPRTVEGIGAHEILSRRQGRYSCIAVTAEFDRDRGSVAGVIGHPYRGLVIFESGRLALCKVSGKPWGAASLNPQGFERDPQATTPRACGGT